ncbi:hypothetical protein M1555_03765 [Patescibacteria group bacterium]|nr:hypothetical protein [Patescibacteria group bacterium]
MKKSIRRAALTAGIVWGLTVFLGTLASVFIGYGTAFFSVFTSIYPGYQLTPGGSVIGLMYGFLDAAVGTYIVVWVYQNLTK